MLSSQEVLSASFFLEQIRSVKDGEDISIPVVVNFGRTALNSYISTLQQLLLSKKPKTVILYKWPYVEYDQASLKTLYELLVHVKIFSIRLDLRHLSEDLIADNYNKTKAILIDMQFKPMIKCDVMSCNVRHDWNRMFLELILIPFNPPIKYRSQSLAEPLHRSQPMLEKPALEVLELVEPLSQSERPATVKIEEAAPESDSSSDIENDFSFVPSGEDMLEPPRWMIIEEEKKEEVRPYCSIM